MKQQVASSMLSLIYRCGIPDKVYIDLPSKTRNGVTAKPLLSYGASTEEVRTAMKLVHMTERSQRITRQGVQINEKYYWNLALAFHCDEDVNVIIIGKALWVWTKENELLGKFVLSGPSQPHHSQ